MITMYVLPYLVKSFPFQRYPFPPLYVTHLINWSFVFKVFFIHVHVHVVYSLMMLVDNV